MLGSLFIDETDDKFAVDGEGDDDKKTRRWRQYYSRLDPKKKNDMQTIELMHKAASTGDLNILTSLVETSRLSPDSQDKKGWTPLLRAAKVGHTAVVDFLCENKADLNPETKDKNTPLMKACKRGQAEVVEILCKAGAELDRKNKGGATAMMLCAMHGKDDPLRHLVRYKADPNQQKDVGYSALMIAARLGKGFQAAQLIHAKANMELVDKTGETAIAKAQKGNHRDIVQLLLENGAEHNVSKKTVSHHNGHSALKTADGQLRNMAASSKGSGAVRRKSQQVN